MKIIVTISIGFFISSCLGQYPKLKISEGKVFNANAPTDTIYTIGKLYTVFDTVKVIMQVSDTSRQKWDTKIYWIRGYRVNADNETFYLDINKKRLPPSVIIWLDQNL